MKSPAAHITMQPGFQNQTRTFDSTGPASERIDPLKDRSTGTQAQLRRVLAALRVSPKTTDELRALGIYQVSARIFALRALGYSISTHLFNDFSTDGYAHQRMARYTLHEPTEPWVRPASEAK